MNKGDVSPTLSHNNKRKNGCGNILEKALIFDVFGQPINLMLPNNEERYKSIIGSFCTFIMVFIVLGYATLKVDLLRNGK